MLMAKVDSANFTVVTDNRKNKDDLVNVDFIWKVMDVVSIIFHKDNIVQIGKETETEKV